MSTLTWVIIAAVAIFIVLNMAIGFVLTKDGMARQKRITQMKRFRNSARAQKVDFTEQDKRTVV
jgi:ammonia channel protein AmtB